MTQLVLFPVVTTTYSLMLCRAHHAMEERGDLIVTFFSERGCDGSIKIEVKR